MIPQAPLLLANERALDAAGLVVDSIMTLAPGFYNGIFLVVSVL